MMFTEVPFMQRFAAAADAGFRGVEYLHPYAEPAAAIAAALRRHGLTQVLFNVPSGDWEAGDRGIACRPDRIDEFRDGVGAALEYAKATGCRKLHAMAGIVPDGAVTRRHLDTYADNVRFLADTVAPEGIDVMVEAINSRVDIPGYLIDTSAKAFAAIAAVDRDNVYFQYDVYHLQIMEGDLARSFERHLARIGHVQIADNPGRNEPGSGEIDYPWLLQRIDELGYDGWVGCEYRPAAATSAGLGWAGAYL